MFTVSSPPAALGPQEFRITISYETNEPGRQSRLLANTGTTAVNPAVEKTMTTI